MRRLILTGAVLAAASPAAAHEEHRHGIGWTLGPEIVLPLLLALALYLVGWVRLRRRAERSHAALDHGARLYLSGWLVLAVALVSPLHEAGERSFAMHMLEHELIMLPAALLLVAARPGPVLLWGLPAGPRQQVARLARFPFWRALAAPMVATVLQGVVLIVWHMPALFDRALGSEGWHVAQHLSFVLSALLFWWAMLPRSAGKGQELASALWLFLTAMIGGGLGALMALDASPWYEAYVRMGMTPFGLTPAQDQQLAGVIMWIPGGLFHLAAAMIFLARAIRQPQKFSTTA
jgi:cytochrome c oxidase assembly factor CtaG